MARADGKALMRAILDEPGDDFHRAVYADFLEENGIPVHPARLAMMRGEVVEVGPRLSWHHVWPKLRYAALKCVQGAGVVVDGQRLRECHGVVGEFVFRRGFLEVLPLGLVRRDAEEFRKLVANCPIVSLSGQVHHPSGCWLNSYGESRFAFLPWWLGKELARALAGELKGTPNRAGYAGGVADAYWYDSEEAAAEDVKRVVLQWARSPQD